MHRIPIPRERSRPRSRAGSLIILIVLLLLPVGAGVGVTHAPAPAAAAGSATPTVASGGSHTCELVPDGTVRCWGRNDKGQLGDGTTTDRPHRVTVVLEDGAPLGGVTAISAGNSHACALLGDGTVRCWGENQRGQLGVSTTATPPTSDPRPHPQSAITFGGTAATAITAGGDHTCVILNTSPTTVRCWGFNDLGQLGNGTTTFGANPTPTAVFMTDTSGPELSGVTRIAAGQSHTCALTTDGTTGGIAQCWGSNLSGEVGNGSSSANLENPVLVADVGGSGSLTGITDISAGGQHTCAVTGGGNVRCWGSNSAGQLGNSATPSGVSRTPIAVLVAQTPETELGGVTAIATGSGHTCALTTDGSTSGIVQCWGANNVGQLGDGTTVNRSNPTPVFLVGTAGATLTDVTSIAPGGQHTCALTSTGAARCWGRSDFGQVGDGTFTTRLNPAAVVDELPIVEPPTVPTPAPSGPAVSCSPDSLAVGTQVTCTVSGGDAGIDILWQAAVNPVIASEGLTLDADGRGTFGFSVPASARGAVVTVELVGWSAPVPIGGGSVVGGPVPSGVPAGRGGGTLPGGLIVLLGGVLAGAVLLAASLHAPAPLTTASRAVLLERRTRTAR